MEKEGYRHCKGPNVELIHTLRAYYLKNSPEEAIEMMQLMDVSFQFRKIKQRIAFEMNKEISHGEFFLLTVVKYYYLLEEKKGLSVSTLAGLMQVSSPAISRMLRGLEEKQMIKREIDEKNRRVTYVTITQVGENILLKSREKMNQLAHNVVEELGIENMKLLVQLLNQAADAMEKNI